MMEITTKSSINVNPCRLRIAVLLHTGTSKNSFLLRTAAISSGGVVRPNIVLDIALAMPAAILTFRLA
jgi:hypothetical protein